MGDKNATAGIKGKKRKVTLKERAPVEEYSHHQKPYHIIQQHIIPYKRTNLPVTLHANYEGRNVARHRKTKKQRKDYSTAVDCHPYCISLFDYTLNSGTPSKKKGKKDKGCQSADYYEVLNWEKELIHEHVDALKAMFEFKQIYFFIRTKKKVLNFSDAPLYIVERMFLMPQESTHLASVMTALLNHCFNLKGYSPEAPMPYRLWNSYLKMKVGEWYNIVASFGGDTVAAANYIGFDHDFFIILGPTNPMQFCDFYDLNLLQKVWLVKSVCNSLTLDSYEVSEEEADESDESFDCPWLGTDRHGHYYFYLSYFKRQENLRVYRLYKYFFPVAGSFYDRIQRENNGQVAPCKKYHELVADDVQSLRRLAGEFAEPLETEDASSQIQNSRRPVRPDCESKLHQQLLDLLSEMEPLESKLKSSTLNMLMLLKSDWDRYHGVPVVSKCNSRNDIEARSSLDEKSDCSEGSRPASPVEHFLVSMLKNKRNVQLKNIVPHLGNVQKYQELNLRDVHITPLKKLTSGSQNGVEILMPFKSKDDCNRTKQIVVCDSKVQWQNDVTVEDSDSKDSILVVESDSNESNNWNPAVASCPVKKGYCVVPLPNGFAVKIEDGETDWWEITSDGCSNSLEVPLENSVSGDGENIRERGKSDFKSIFAKPFWHSSTPHSQVDAPKELHPRTSVASKHQPLVIHIGNDPAANTNRVQLSSCNENQNKSVAEDVQEVNGLPYAGYRHKATGVVSSEPKTSALSVVCKAENNHRPPRVHTARKSFPSSHRRLVSAVGENTSVADVEQSSPRTVIHENICCRSYDPSVCNKSGSKLSVKHEVSRRYVSVQPVVSLEKITSCCESTHTKDTSFPTGSKSVNKSSLNARKATQCFNHHSDLTPFPDRVSSHDNKDESFDNRNESLNVSNRTVSAKNYPISQQLIYTLSPMETSFTIRNSLETRISATKDHMPACDNGKKIPSQENKCLGVSDTLSSGILADNAKKEEKNHGKSDTLLQKTVNNCRSVVKSSSALISSTPVTCTLSSNSKLSGVNLTKNSGDCLKLSKPKCLVKSNGAPCHESTTVINPSELRSATGSDAGVVCPAVTSNSANVCSTELIPVVLPNGKNMLLRVIQSQSASTKTSLPNSSCRTSLAKNGTLPTVSTNLKTSGSSLKAPPLTRQSTSRILQVFPIFPSTESSADKPTSLASDMEDGESKMKDEKFANQDSSSEMDQICTSSDVTPVSTSKAKRMTYAQKIQEILKSSETCGDAATVEKFGDAIAEKSGSVVSVEDSDNDVSVEESGDVVSVEKSGDVITTVEQTKSVKRKLLPQPKIACTSVSTPSSVSMPKVKKVEIPLMASKILSNLSSDGTTPTETLSNSSSAPSVSSCNSVCTPQVVNVNTGTIGFTEPVNQVAGNALNILNVGDGASGGIIILGQPQSGNSTIFAHPAAPVNQTPLILVPSMVSTPCAQPLTSPAAYTTPLLSNPGSNSIVSSNNIVSSPCIPNSQPLVFLCQNQLYMVPSMVTSNTLPVIAPMPQNPPEANHFASHSGASTASGSSLTRNANHERSTVNEAEDGWEVVPDPFESTKVQFEDRKNVSRNFRINFFPKKKETAASSSSEKIPEFPGNTEPPVLTSNKKATEKYNLNLNMRPPLTLDEPITVIPCRKQDM